MSRPVRECFIEAGDMAVDECRHLKQTLTSPTAWALFGAISAGKVGVLAMAKDAVVRHSWSEGVAAFLIENVLLNYYAIPWLTGKIDKGFDAVCDHVPAFKDAHDHMMNTMRNIGKSLTHPAIDTAVHFITPMILMPPAIAEKIAKAPVRALIGKHHPTHHMHRLSQPHHAH